MSVNGIVHSLSPFLPPAAPAIRPSGVKSNADNKRASDVGSVTRVAASVGNPRRGELTPIRVPAGSNKNVTLTCHKPGL
jgi:hypothetical protein